MPLLSTPSIGTASVGMDTTLTGIISNAIPDVKAGVLIHDQASAPLMSYLQESPGALLQATQLDYYWNEIRLDNPAYLTNSSGIPSGTSVTVTIAYPAIIEGALFKEHTSDQFLIVYGTPDYATTPGSSICTLKKPDGSAITAVAGIVTLVDNANAMVEGGDFLAPVSSYPAKFQNSIMSSSVQIKASTQKTLSQQYWGWPWDMDKLARVTQLKQGVNRALFDSRYYVENAYLQQGITGELRTTGGIFDSILTRRYVNTAPGKVTQDIWEDYLITSVFPDQFSGSSTKLCLLGGQLGADINSFVSTHYRTQVTGVQIYGANVTGYEFVGGKRLIMVHEPCFNQMQGLYHGACTLDPANIYMYQYGSNLFEMKDTTNPQSTAHSMGFMTMYGGATEFELSHSLFLDFN